MLIDIIFAALLLMAVIKGYSKGLIIGVFSLVALIIGIAAAMKFSTVVASLMKDSVQISARWLPVLAFAVVFIVAVILVRLGAKALEKTIELAMLGWINRIGGILLYLALYTVIFSIILFYADKIHLISPATIAASKTYSLIQPWGAKVMNAMGSFIPFFSNMFHELEDFFSRLSERIPEQ